jgi:hypothetical protein
MTSETEISIKIEQLNIIGTWDFPETKFTQNMCNLCKHHIMAPHENIIKGKYETKISIGKCKHSFHTICINTTLKKNNSSLCPICITPWNFDKEFDNDTSYYKINFTK